MGRRPARKVFFLASLALATAAARAAEPLPLDIGVRAAVRDARDPAAGGKVYAVASVELLPSPEKLVKPVDADALLRLFHAELRKQGFRPAVPPAKPEIVLTLAYGRGAVVNPFLSEANSVNEASEFPTVTISGASTQLLRQREFGVEEKLQKSQFEKLVIYVTAWKRRTAPKEKVRKLWTTTMVVDDPDHRDLNEIARQMLATGAVYFGQQVRDEVEISGPVRAGRVEVGAPTVVDPPKKSP